MLGYDTKFAVNRVCWFFVVFASSNCADMNKFHQITFQKDKAFSLSRSGQVPLHFHRIEINKENFGIGVCE